MEDQVEVQLKECRSQLAALRDLPTECLTPELVEAKSALEEAVRLLEAAGGCAGQAGGEAEPKGGDGAVASAANENAGRAAPPLQWSRVEAAEDLTVGESCIFADRRLNGTVKWTWGKIEHFGLVDDGQNGHPILGQKRRRLWFYQYPESIQTEPVSKSPPSPETPGGGGADAAGGGDESDAMEISEEEIEAPPAAPPPGGAPSGRRARPKGGGLKIPHSYDWVAPTTSRRARCAADGAQDAEAAASSESVAAAVACAVPAGVAANSGGSADSDSDDDDGRDGRRQLILVSMMVPTTQRLRRCRNVRSACPFGKRCKFHHGRYVTLDDVRKLVSGNPYTFPLARGSRVFVYTAESKLWRRGSVEGHFFVADGRPAGPSDAAGADPLAAVFVSLRHKEGGGPVESDDDGGSGGSSDIVVARRDVIPIISGAEADPTGEAAPAAAEAEVEAASSSDTSASELESDDETSPIADGSALAAAEDFAAWERYTGGRGSKIMRLMGYQMGAALGREDRPTELGPCAVNPVPIRRIPPRASLDFVFAKRKMAKSRRPAGGPDRAAVPVEARKTAEFQFARGGGVVRTSGGAGGHEDDDGGGGRERRSCRVFRWMNSGMMEGQQSVEARLEAESKAAEDVHQESLRKLRTSKRSDDNLRKDLMKLGAELAAKQEELAGAEKNLRRHSGPDGVNTLKETYQTQVENARRTIRHLTESQSALRKQLEGRGVKKKLKIF